MFQHYRSVSQLVIIDALETDNPKDFSREDFRVVMAYLIFLKEKRGGTIKAQVCCDRSIQQNNMTKEETRSPTIMQESLIVIFNINAMEGRDVAVANIPVAFIQKDMMHINQLVCVRLCGVLSYILVRIEPETFVDKVLLEGGQRVIYAALKKALYGALIESLLFSWYLSSVLRS